MNFNRLPNYHLVMARLHQLRARMRGAAMKYNNVGGSLFVNHNGSDVAIESLGPRDIVGFAGLETLRSHTQKQRGFIKTMKALAMRAGIYDGNQRIVCYGYIDRDPDIFRAERHLLNNDPAHFFTIDAAICAKRLWVDQLKCGEKKLPKVFITLSYGEPHLWMMRNAAVIAMRNMGYTEDKLQEFFGSMKILSLGSTADRMEVGPLFRVYRVTNINDSVAIPARKYDAHQGVIGVVTSKDGYITEEFVVHPKILERAEKEPLRNDTGHSLHFYRELISQEALEFLKGSEINGE